MKKRSSSETDEPVLLPRFLKQEQTVKFLELADATLTSLNYYFDCLSHDDNSTSQSLGDKRAQDPVFNRFLQPYEGAVLFAFDQPIRAPRDIDNHTTASALLFKQSTDNPDSTRLEFTKDEVVDRRVFLHQTSIPDGIFHDRAPTLRSSRLNFGKQAVMNYPLVIDPLADKRAIIGSIELDYTINQDRNWVYPAEKDIEKIWSSHRKSIHELSRALAELAGRTMSLSRSLEIAPPINPNAYVVYWTVNKLPQPTIPGNYPIFSAYLENYKSEISLLTNSLADKLSTDIQVVDGIDSQHIIISMDNVDTTNPKAVQLFNQQVIEPFKISILKAYQAIASSFSPDIFVDIRVNSAPGVIENGLKGEPIGPVLYQLSR